jgi:hypothetical protein
MRKTLLILLLVAGVLALAVTPGYTWGRGGVFIGVGPYWGPYPYYYPPAYYYPPPYYPPPTVVVEQPPVYVQQPAPPQQVPPPPPSSSGSYWYYCSSAKGYYPTVASCPEEWVKVPPR